MEALYLTSAEERLFRALPSQIIDGLEVVGEQINFQDTPARRYARLDLMKLEAGSPLRQQFESIRVDTDENSIVSIASGIDPKSLSEQDLREVFFVLGPAGMSVLISKALSLVKSSLDLDGVAALAAIRHELISSLPAR